MKAGLARHPRLEWLLAALLRYGTWLASAVIGLGLILALLNSPPGAPNLRLVTVGIAMFILLPVLRVLLMLIIFQRERDYHYTAIAALVLAIILLGFALGLQSHAKADSKYKIAPTARQIAERLRI